MLRSESCSRPSRVADASHRLAASLRVVVAVGSLARASAIAAKFPHLAALLTPVAVSEPSKEAQVGFVCRAESGGYP